jgi:DNA-binding response OmpR family regulator
MLMTPQADGYSIGTVMLVEDEAMVAVMIEDFLLDLGATEVIVCGTIADAEALVGHQPLQCAILDVKIGDADSSCLADELSRRKVPFFFATAVGPEVIPERHRHRPILAKPFSNEQLLEFVLVSMADAQFTPSGESWT